MKSILQHKKLYLTLCLLGLLLLAGCGTTRSVNIPNTTWHFIAPDYLSGNDAIDLQNELLAQAQVRDPQGNLHAVNSVTLLGIGQYVASFLVQLNGSGNDWTFTTMAKAGHQWVMINSTSVSRLPITIDKTPDTSANTLRGHVSVINTDPKQAYMMSIKPATFAAVARYADTFFPNGNTTSVTIHGFTGWESTVQNFTVLTLLLPNQQSLVCVTTENGQAVHSLADIVVSHLDDWGIDF